MARQPVRTDRAPAAIGPYSQAVLADGWLFVSGQIGMDPSSGQLVGGGVVREAEQAISNLRAIIESAGLGLTKVVKTTLYLRDLADFQAVNEVYSRHFQDPFPARVTVEVSNLPKGAALEIDAIVEV